MHGLLVHRRRHAQNRRVRARRARRAPHAARLACG